MHRSLTMVSRLLAAVLMVIGSAVVSAEPAPRFSLNSPPTAAVASDFMQRFHEVVAAAGRRTPSGSGADLATRAQRQFATDKALVDDWHNAGITLFVAAGTHLFGSCLDAMTAEQKAWEVAYPINGKADATKIAERDALIAKQAQLRKSCEAAIKSKLG